MTRRTLPLALYAFPLVAGFMLPNLATPLMELWRADIGFSAGTLTLIFIMYLGGLAPAFLLAPGLSDSWGRKRTQQVAVVLGIVSCLLYVLADSIPVLLLARILTGLCSGTLLVLAPSAVQGMASEDESSKATLTATLGIAIGLAGGPLFAGVVAQLAPWPTKTVFVLMAILLAISLVVVGTEPETERKPRRDLLPHKGLGRRDKRVVITGLGAFGPGMTAAGIVLALSPTLLNGISETSGPLGAGLIAGGMYAISPIAQSVVRRLHSLAHIRLSLVLIALAMCSFGIAMTQQSVWILLLSAVLIGAGQGISNLGSFGLIHQEVHEESVPGATALLSLGTYVAASVVPLAGGYLIDLTGLPVASLCMALGVILMVAVGSVFARQSYIDQTRTT